jgi:hypothetical protein
MTDHSLRSVKAQERIATALERLADAAELYADRDPLKLMEAALAGDDGVLAVHPDDDDLADIPASEAWRFE